MFVWSPCGSGGILNINDILRLDKDPSDEKAAGTLAVYDATLQFSQNISIIWKKCGT
jgi:hypothetical protein